MAFYWIGNIGVDSDYNDGTKWSATSGGAPLGSFPTLATDHVFFDANSLGNCRINVLSQCGNFILTGFTHGFIFNNNLSVSGAILNFGTGVAWSGTGRLQLNSSTTITSTGLSSDRIGVTVTFSTGAGTFVIVNKLYVSTLSSTTNGTIFVSGDDIYDGGDLSLGNTFINNSNYIIMDGTGTITSSIENFVISTLGRVANLRINTAGIITLRYFIINNNLDWVAGTLDTANANLMAGNLTAVVWNLLDDMTIQRFLTGVSSITINGVGKTLTVKQQYFSAAVGAWNGTASVKFIDLFECFATPSQGVNTPGAFNLPVTIQPSTTFLMNSIHIAFTNSLTVVVADPKNVSLNFPSVATGSPSGQQELRFAGGTIDLAGCSVNGNINLGSIGGSISTVVTDIIVNGSLNITQNYTCNGAKIKILRGLLSTGGTTSGTTIAEFSNQGDITALGNTIFSSPYIFSGIFNVNTSLLQIASTNFSITGLWTYNRWSTTSLQLNNGAILSGLNRIRNLKSLILAGNATIDSMPNGVTFRDPLVVSSSVSTTQRTITLTKNIVAQNVKVGAMTVPTSSSFSLGLLRGDWNMGNNSGKIFHISQSPHGLNTLQ